MGASRLLRAVLPAPALMSLLAVVAVAGPAGADDPPLRVMTTGLGSGVVQSGDTPRTIDCGSGGPCDAGYLTTDTVTLTAVAAPGSRIAGWEGDCTGGAGVATCPLAMTSARSVRVRFDLITAPATLTDLSPDGIRTYLMSADPAHVALDSPARFLAALPAEYKHNWLLMTRSESLQPGVAGSPRILLPSADATKTFTIALGNHSSYPGADPNAIEYMQWDADRKNFRFHEIVVGPIRALGCFAGGVTPPQPVECTTPGATAPLFPPRSRSISIDDAKCPKCHSTRNVPNLNRTPYPAVPGTAFGTDGDPPGSVGSKNKPNWDTYDSWGGLLGFNRDRIYQGSVEAATFRALFNPWTWRANAAFGRVLEQLELQPPVPGIPAAHVITRTAGGADDGHVNFAFDAGAIVNQEPAPGSLPTTGPDATTTNPSVNYRFDRTSAGTAAGSSVIQGGKFVTLHHSGVPSSDEGRGVHYFDLLGGSPGAPGGLNQQRIADEIIHHRVATGSVPIDVRPLALAIRRGCLVRSPGSPDAVTPALAGGVAAFFTARQRGNTLDQIVADTAQRAHSLPRRKADIEKFNLDRTNDNYLDNTAPGEGLIQRNGPATLPAPGTSTAVERVRQEVFRRPLVDGTGTFPADASEIGGDYVDREDYGYNTERVALYRYFLEPLGVSVDKWSMGVRGRSRTYTFADVFDDPNYETALTTTIEQSLSPRTATNPDGDPYPGLTAFDCASLLVAVNDSLRRLPPAGDIPRYTDVQRILNKGCIECHGGQGYPPFSRYFDVSYLDLSEDETNTIDRLARSHRYVTGMITPFLDTAYIAVLINRSDESCDFNGTSGVFRMMPCGGPKLSPADIATFERWVGGGQMLTHGDPHITTLDGTPYDFQATGEFTLARGEDLEIQARQSAVATEAPLGPNEHTGLSSCVSLNTAVAIRVGPHRISYQPRPGSPPDPDGLVLFVDGKQTPRPTTGAIALAAGGRILATTAPGGLQIEYPGGTDIVITPGWWAYYRVWHLDLDVRHVRATDGIMGKIAPGNWLPALPDGSVLGARPAALSARYDQLYGTFAEAWRVTDATSLFSYGPGESPRASITPGWPRLEPRSCVLPPRDKEHPPLPPLPMVPADVASRACAGLVDPARRANCQADVRVTGEVGFATSYLAGEKIARNTPPSPPALTAPAPDQVDLPPDVTFTWTPTVDKEGDPLTYLHCVWPLGSSPTFAQCTQLPAPPPPLGGHLGHLLALLLLLLLILLVLLVRAHARRPLVVLLAILVAIAVVFLLYLGRVRPPTTLSRSVSGLQPGKAYYWKVIAQDGHGGTIDSEIRRIAIR